MSPLDALSSVFLPSFTLFNAVDDPRPIEQSITSVGEYNETTWQPTFTKHIYENTRRYKRHSESLLDVPNYREPVYWPTERRSARPSSIIFPRAGQGVPRHRDLSVVVTHRLLSTKVYIVF
jgi:hypothetical protein